jgi:hypothetical protein
MSRNSAASVIPSADDCRPLPARPNLEYERKAAKELLKAWRVGDPEAVRRMKAGGQRPGASDLQLADAQFTIAREYGFASWPKLVAYYQTCAMHSQSGPKRLSMGVDHLDARAASLLREHQHRLSNSVQFLAAYVPRFIGRNDEEILAAVPTHDEARLAMARSEGLPSWEALLALPSPPQTHDPKAFRESPFGRAIAAVEAGDIATLATIVDEHPEFLDPEYQVVNGGSVPSRALGYAQSVRGAVRPIDASQSETVVKWLTERGVNMAVVATRMLARLGMRATTEMVRDLLARGADPTYLLPNGVGVLDRLLLLAWNPEAVDLIASRMTPRKAFWIAAGLGDVAAMKGYFDQKGRLTEAARADRPDFVAIGLGMPCRPDAADREILWEAFMVASFNRRTAAIDLLLEKGFPIDFSPWGQNILHVAVGNRLADVVEMLVHRGADVDLRGYMPSTTAREAATAMFREAPDDPNVQRIYHACTG